MELGWILFSLSCIVFSLYQTSTWWGGESGDLNVVICGFLLVISFALLKIKESIDKLR